MGSVGEEWSAVEVHGTRWRLQEEAHRPLPIGARGPQGEDRYGSDGVVVRFLRDHGAGAGPDYGVERGRPRLGDRGPQRRRGHPEHAA